MRVSEGIYPVIERRLLDGTIDFYIGPLPAAGAATGLREEALFDNPRIVRAGKGHPLRRATSLAELTGADWITTSITDDPQPEFNDLFLRHGLPPPRLALNTESMLTWLVALHSTGMLAISPQLHTASVLLNAQVVRVPVKEALPGPPIMLVQRAAIPLTPAAEHLANLLRRARLRHASSGRPA